MPSNADLLRADAIVMADNESVDPAEIERIALAEALFLANYRG